MPYLHIDMHMNAIGFKQALGGKPWNVKPCHVLLLLGGWLMSWLLATGLGRRAVISHNGNQKSPAWLVEVACSQVAGSKNPCLVSHTHLACKTDVRHG